MYPQVWILNPSQEVVYNFKPDFTWQCMPERLPCYTKLMLKSSSSYFLSQAQAQKPEQSHNNLRWLSWTATLTPVAGERRAEPGSLWTAGRAAIKIPPTHDYMS